MGIIRRQQRHHQLIVAMVGLPGRGKSFIARSIVRHLDWIGLKSRIFSVKDRRRQEVAMYEPAEYFEAGTFVCTSNVE